jgi:gamma-glutamylputrescine oxidase
MTVSRWQRQHSFKIPDMNTDVLIIGGGFVGLSVAFWLTEFQPETKITILERSHCGAGASGRNAGFLTVGSASFYKTLFEKWGTSRAMEIKKFASDSLELVHQNILKVSPELQYEKTSSMTLFQTNMNFESWSTENYKPNEFGFKWINQGGQKDKIPHGFFGAYESLSEFKINPYKLLASLRKMLESRKVQIIEDSSAFEINEQGIMTEVNTIKAQKVVLAMNGYLPEFSSAFEKYIIPRRAQMLAVETEAALPFSHLYYDPIERLYWRMSEDNILLIGGKRIVDEASEVGCFDKISSSVQNSLENYLAQRLNLKFKVINRWSGVMGFTENELPLVEQVKAPLETYVVGGFSGHGMGFGFKSAKEVSELIVGIKKESFFSQFKKVDIKL